MGATQERGGLEVELGTRSASGSSASFEVSNPIASPTGGRAGDPPRPPARRDGTLRCRLLLSLFAVSLMWMCSLSVAVAITGLVVAVPDADLVRATCDRAYRTTRAARSDYVSCVGAQLDRCEAFYASHAEAAVAATTDALAANAATLDAHAATRAACSSAVTTALGALDAWQALDTAHAVPYVCDDCAAPCDATDAALRCSCDDAKTLVGDVGAVRSEAFATASDFAATSAAAVDALAAYAAARAAYDAAYVANRTAATRAAVAARIAAVSESFVGLSDASFPAVFDDVDLAAACLSGRSDANGTHTCFVDDARDAYDAFRTRVDVQVDLATGTVDAYAAEAAAYQARVGAAFSKMADFYDGVTGWIAKIGVSAPVDDWFGFGLEDFYAAPGAWPDSFPELPMPGADALYPPSLRAVYDALLVNITAAAAATRKRAEAAAEALASVADLVVADDYDPPSYADFAPPAAPATVANASAAHASAADAFLKKQAVTLNAFADLSNGASTTSLPAINVSQAADAAQSVLDDLRRTWFDWAPLAGSSYDVDLVFLSVSSVTSLLVILDYCWRTFQSARVVRRFLGRGAVALPRPDMSLDRAGDRGGGACRSAYAMFVANPAFFVANLVLSPLGGIVLLSAFAVLVAAALAQAYVPLFNESFFSGVFFRLRARGSTPTTKGTRPSASRAAARAATARSSRRTSTRSPTTTRPSTAARPTPRASTRFHGPASRFCRVVGRAEPMVGDRYDARRAEHCSAYGTSSARQQEEDDLFLESMVASQDASAGRAALLRHCVDAETVDASLAVECCGLEGYDACGAGLAATDLCPLVSGVGAPYAPVAPTLAERACDVVFSASFSRRPPPSPLAATRARARAGGRGGVGDPGRDLRLRGAAQVRGHVRRAVGAAAPRRVAALRVHVRVVVPRGLAQGRGRLRGLRPRQREPRRRRQRRLQALLAPRDAQRLHVHGDVRRGGVAAPRAGGPA